MKSRFAGGCSGIGPFPDTSARPQGSLCGIAGILLPTLEAEVIPQLRRRSPRGPTSHVVMGTVSHKENPEVTVSESNEQKTRCLQARDRHLLAVFLAIGRCL